MPPRLTPDQIPPDPDLSFEQALWAVGLSTVAGLDEAGRGTWAGPVMAAAVILPDQEGICRSLHGVRDSKQLRPEVRSSLVPLIEECALAWAVGSASAAEIDEIGILPATRLSMLRALQGLTLPADHLLIDALFLPDVAVPQTALIKGDQRSLSIAAASILAKTSRDAWMVEQEAFYPEYGFARHKGYGTALHQERLQRYGPCPIHRRSFAPVAALLKK